MPFKLNISEKGKAFRLETDIEEFVGKKIGDKISGKEINKDLEGYELEITGSSDSAGFPGKKDEDGHTLRRVLLKRGWGCWTEPKGLRKHPVKMPEGLRLRKTVRGNTLSRDTVQINMSVLKAGKKKLSELFPEQNQPKEKKAEETPAPEKPVEKPEEQKPAETKKAEKPAEQPVEEEEKTEKGKPEQKEEKKEQTQPAASTA